ncbi:MAG: DNA cytosine methyltransferase [Crocinitomicaceae bacterium]|nr:DNA cytosine methyltransferase [Flavobacteriales bacterium]NQZ36000.1 DNA cytosine methyltransferase [Crocinitomicaceae bacterium]
MKLDSVNERSNYKGKVVSLYSGAGGMDIGFHMAGYDIIWSNDIDSNAVKTYKSIFPNHKATVGNLIDQKLPEVDDVDLVIGGPPCQGFSVAGKMDPDDPRSKHVWNFLGVVGELSPRGFVMENVKSLAINTRWKELLQNLRDEAKKMGYQTELFVLNASHYGVPQARERMFLIGTKEGKVVEPTKTTEFSPRTVRDVLSDLPDFGKQGNDSICTAIITPAKNPILRKSPYAGMLFNGQGRPLNIDAPALTLPASMGGNRTPIIDQNDFHDNKESWIIKYHTGLLNGGKSKSKAPKHLRRITVEEAAIIQTFPKEMEFLGSQTSRYRQIGNAVPPLLAYHVANSVADALGVNPGNPEETILEVLEEINS